jgi:transposase
MRIEVLTGVERRRRWRDEDKARLVAESLAPGVTVSEVSRRHGVAQSVLFAWRRQAREGLLAASVPTPDLLPVRIQREEARTSSLPEAPAQLPPPGVIEIDLGGRVCVRVGYDVDAEALRRVLGTLRRR